MGSQYKKRKGEAWWAEQIAAQERSGLTQRVFCAERGIVMSSFSRWRARLRGDGEADGAGPVEAAPVRFVEVELPGQDRPLVRVSVGEVTVDFETLPPPAWVAELATHRGLRC